MISCRLEFLCTNNTAEYEAHIQGLKKALDLNVKFLIAFGDSEIIVRKVRNSIHCFSNHLQTDQKEVWNLISVFDSFNIESIPHFQNQEADLLANLASQLIPSENFSPNVFSVELLFRPSIPDNITNWHVFNDDLYIIEFLMREDAFKESTIDEIMHDEYLHNFSIIHPPHPVDQYFGLVNSIPTSVLRL